MKDVIKSCDKFGWIDVVGGFIAVEEIQGTGDL